MFTICRPIICSNLCPDEKGTESACPTLHWRLDRTVEVATYAPMKRGLKVIVSRLIALGSSIYGVATYAPMKRGLKDSKLRVPKTPARIKYVATYAPMKRGLKGLSCSLLSSFPTVHHVATYAPMKRGLKVVKVYLFEHLGLCKVATYAPMKRGLKVSIHQCCHYRKQYIGSNLCPDEKGTERSTTLRVIRPKFCIYSSNLCPDEKGTERQPEISIPAHGWTK